jgi:hypothetical protein
MIRSHIDRLVLAALAASGAIAACSVSSTEPPGSSSGNGSTTAGTNAAASGTPGAGTAGSANPGTGGTGTSAGSPGTAGSVTATAGATTGGSGSGTFVPLCTTKVTAQSPSIADFELYDGTTAPTDYRWTFGGAAPGQLGVYTGTYVYGDGSAEPMLTLLAGHGGNYGLTVSVTNTSKWGEGFGFYVLDSEYKPACIDATAYKGVTMWVRGMVPTGTLSFSVSMSQATRPGTTAPGGSCTGSDDTTCKSPTKSDIPISTTWSQVDVLWADLTDGLAGPDVPLAANGDNITGFSFGANLTFEPESEGSMTYVPVPGDISVVVDDIAFIP